VGKKNPPTRIVWCLLMERRIPVRRSNQLLKTKKGTQKDEKRLILLPRQEPCGQTYPPQGTRTPRTSPRPPVATPYPRRRASPPRVQPWPSEESSLWSGSVDEQEAGGRRSSPLSWCAAFFFGAGPFFLATPPAVVLWTGVSVRVCASFPRAF
jgi:hypothetical protein